MRQIKMLKTLLTFQHQIIPVSECFHKFRHCFRYKMRLLCTQNVKCTTLIVVLEDAYIAIIVIPGGK